MRPPNLMRINRPIHFPVHDYRCLAKIVLPCIFGDQKKASATESDNEWAASRLCSMHPVIRKLRLVPHFIIIRCHLQFCISRTEITAFHINISICNIFGNSVDQSGSFKRSARHCPNRHGYTFILCCIQNMLHQILQAVRHDSVSIVGWMKAVIKILSFGNDTSVIS